MVRAWNKWEERVKQTDRDTHLEDAGTVDVRLPLHWVIVLQVEAGNLEVGLQLVVYAVLPDGTTLVSTHNTYQPTVSCPG